MKYGIDSIQLRSLASLKDDVYVRLYSTNNNKVKEYMAQHGIEGSLRRKDTWIAILENMDAELEQYVEPVKTLSKDDSFILECDRLDLDESEVLNVYPNKIEFLDDVIYKGDDYVCDYILSHRAENEVIPYQVITTETTESVYTIPASQDELIPYVVVDPTMSSEEIVQDLIDMGYEVTDENIAWWTSENLRHDESARAFILAANEIAHRQWQTDPVIDYRTNLHLKDADSLGFWQWIQTIAFDPTEIRAIMDNYECWNY